MASNEQLQQVFEDFQREAKRPASLREAVEWGLRNGRLSVPVVDPVSVVATQMQRALRAKTAVDAEGNEYRVYGAMKFTGAGGIQESLWANIDMGSTPHAFVEESVGQRRKGILDDCVKLKADVDHYNTVHSGKTGRKPLQLSIDFTVDVNEREALRRDKTPDPPPTTPLN